MDDYIERLAEEAGFVWSSEKGWIPEPVHGDADLDDDSMPF